MFYECLSEYEARHLEYPIHLFDHSLYNPNLTPEIMDKNKITSLIKTHILNKSNELQSILNQLT